MGILSRRNVILLLILAVEEREHFHYPRNLEDAKSLGRILLRYKERHFIVVLAGVSAVYLMLQSFAIPGSIFLTILSGYLFSFPVALALVCLCSAAGATVCYFISYMFGRRLIVYYFPARLALWQIEKHGQVVSYPINGAKFPLLLPLVHKYHSATMSSSECERVFSAANYILDDRRKNLSMENLEMQLFLHENLLIYGFNIE
uniref:Dimer_Tnp_hAT domain-containing protein n=1 Tax=Meloidogyne hapla TaxID=6305 RepID=A0A1I8B8N7_MELHA